jgi:signal transduction histidine kinase
LTGGIVHDFNNSLQSIVAALELVRKLIAAGRGKETERFIANAIGAAQRAAALNDRLLSFSSSRPAEPRPISLNEVVAGIEDMVRRSLPHSIVLALDVATDLWECHCDVEEAEVAVLNLILHARDALSNGGVITIHTHNADTAGEAAVHAADVPPGEYACLVVTCTRTGLEPGVTAGSSGQSIAESSGSESARRLTIATRFAHRNAGEAKIHGEIGGRSSVVVYLPRYRG